MYKLLRAILFLFDPEKVHYFSMEMLQLLSKIGFVKKMMQSWYTPVIKTDTINFNTGTTNSIVFRNIIGLGAGFDKNAKYLDELELLGFGFVEIGTVTPKPQEGNEKPRLFRLPKDKALINRMGFNNDGVEVITQRLSEWRVKKAKSKQSKEKQKKQETGALDSRFSINNSPLIIGGNIGKNKSTPNEDAWKDYSICFTALYEYVDYFVVNVSSPNTPGLRELQEKESLRKIFSALQSQNIQKENPKPIFLKIAPDLSEEQVNDVIDLALEIQLDGLIVSNTTIMRNNLETGTIQLEKIGAGGLSGMPLKEKSTELIRYIHSKTNGKITIIGSGGIFTGADAKEKINAGASLIQVWTGFIYEGPAIVKKISNYLAANK